MDINIEKPELINGIKYGIKTSFITSPIKTAYPDIDHPVAGDIFYFYTNLGTDEARKFNIAVCTQHLPISINFEKRVQLKDKWLDAAEKARLAKADGFENFGELFDHYKIKDHIVFEGYLIRFNTINDAYVSYDDLSVYIDRQCRKPLI